MVYSDDDQSIPSLENGDSVTEMLNWANGGVGKQDNGYVPKTENYTNEPYRFSPYKGQYQSDWPCVSKQSAIKKEEHNTGLMAQDRDRIGTGRQVTFESNVSKADLKVVKDDVTHVRRDLDRVVAETRTPLAKLDRIEDLLQQSLLCPGESKVATNKATTRYLELSRTSHTRTFNQTTCDKWSTGTQNGIQMGFKWSTGTQNHYYVDNALCFGIKSAPYIFDCISNFLARALKEQGMGQAHLLLENVQLT